jgi:hypothetical protein
VAQAVKAVAAKESQQCVQDEVDGKVDACEAKC